MQNTFSQGKEDLFVLNYFGDYKGNLLSIGENDGTTFSNSRLLIENNWKAILVEPGETYNDIVKLHGGNNNVIIRNYGIGDREEVVKFWESEEHIEGGSDKGLVSTINFEETKRWPNVKFKEKEIELVPFLILEKYAPFDFISIDTEGNDLLILEQIDLEKVGCRCLCVEWNSKHELLEKFVDYCVGYKLVHFNAENLIFCK